MFLTVVLMVLWTTTRHEFSHALMAIAEGADILTLRVVPGIHPDLGFYFGYVDHSGGTSWLTDAAPYLCDLVLVGVTFLLLRRIGEMWRRPVLLAGVVSPMIDLVYNYLGGLWRAGTDVADLFVALPPSSVHLGFLGSIACCMACLLMPSRVSTTEGLQDPESMARQQRRE